MYCKCGQELVGIPENRYCYVCRIRELEAELKQVAKDCQVVNAAFVKDREKLKAELAEANGLLDEVYRKVFGYDAYHPAYKLAEKVLYTLAKRKG